MRDLSNIQARLTDALAHFPHFQVSFEYDAVCIKNTREKDWEAQEIIIGASFISVEGAARDDVGYHPFMANGHWFAVVAIVFAVLSGRE